MKKLNVIFALLLGIFAIQGCSEASSDDDSSFYLDISRSSITLSSADATSETISIDCSHSWSTSCDADWITISPSSGDSGQTTVTVAITANATGSDRSESITISADGITESITVSQPCYMSGDTYLSISTMLMSLLTPDAEAKSITIVASETWNATITEGTSWVSITPNTGSAGESSSTITISENTSTEIQTAKILFSISDSSYDKELTITQPAATVVDAISLNPTSKSFTTAVEQIFDLIVTSNTSWSATNIPTWVELSKEEGNDTETISVKCLENTEYIARAEAQILFTAGTATATLTLNQAAAVEPTLTLDKYSNSVEAAAGSFTIALTANTDWELKSKPTWVTSISPSSASSSTTVTVAYSEQSATSIRTEDIVFTYNNKDVTYTLTQAGAAQSVISTLPSGSVDVSAAAYNFAVTVTCEGSFTVSPNKDWVTYETNGNIVTIKCAENIDTTTQVAVVTFTAQSGESTSITINQAAATAYCSVSPDSDINVYQSAISQELTISSNTSWSISSSNSWFTFEGSTTGTGAGSVILKADANTTSTTKSAKITLQATGCDAVVINVTQSGPQLPDFSTEEL